MKSYLREQARQLRREGKSVKEIQQALGVSKSSVSLWVRDIPLTEDQRLKLEANEKVGYKRAQQLGAQANKEKGLAQRKTYQDIGRTMARQMRPLHLAGCMLYWAEGSKDRNSIAFVNSDPHMLRFFMRFLREEMNLDDSLILIKIHCHTNVPGEIERIEQFWLNTLSLPQSSLRKTVYKKGNNALTHRILTNGVCGIWIYRSEVVQHILGAIQEYGGFDNPDWLL